MIASTTPTADAVTTTAAWLEARGIAARPWPAGRYEIDRGADAATEPGPRAPVLYLVEPGELPPPRWGDHEDWIRLPAGIEELHGRARDLLRRCAEVVDRPQLGQDDVLEVAGHTVGLSPIEARLLRPLIDGLGELVTRQQITDAMWPTGDAPDRRALDSRLRVVRRRLRGLPLHIHTLRGRGFLLEHRPVAPS